MNLSMKWLKEFVPVEVNPKEFADAMTMSGSKVEGWETEGEKIDKIVVGKVLDIQRHPDADKLVVCQVDVGQGTPVQIVTGATNLKTGDIVPVCLDGSTLPDGRKIKKGKLRGVESCGMLCSLGELGLTAHDFPYAVEDGIFVLQEPCELGQDIRSAIGLDDTKVEFEITPNRPDCLSVIGLAREAAATFGKDFHLPVPSVKAGHGDASALLNVAIQAPDLCPVYAARIVKNVRVKPSPRWMRERLRAMGVRPINNIVDITNYVMLEYGQPMHAFDLRYLEDGKIIVRRAQEGETITTLDGVDRTLHGDQLVIADARKPVAIAGVMGGEYSGIMDDTTTIVFESANFKGSSVRITAREQGMRTDASSRYEKGLDPNNCLPALARACELVELLDAGDVLDGIVTESHIQQVERKIPLVPEWINRFLGTEIDVDFMVNTLRKLDFQVENGQVLVPSFRGDVEDKADIAEEIARFYGYNKIPSTIVRGSAQGKYSPEQKFEQKANQTLLALGCSEIMTYSFISPKAYDKIGMPAGHPLRRSVVISNPLGEDTSVMRTTALPSMMDVLARNYNNRNASAWLYEIAKEYIPNGEQELPDENKVVVIGLYDQQADFFTLKGIVEELLETLRISDYEVEASQNEYSYHPGRCAVLTAGEERIGVLGEIHPNVAANYGIDQRVYAAVLYLDKMRKHAGAENKYRPLPKFPAVTRDLALVCDETVPVARLQKAIRRGGGKLLEDIKLFDVYQGAQIPNGKKSVAYNIVLRSATSTLTEEEVGRCMEKIMKNLEAEGAILRG